MTNDIYNAMSKIYSDTLEDINALDVSNNTISKIFKGTGTLGENDAYMKGFTSGIEVSGLLEKILIAEATKKQLIIDILQDNISCNLYKYSYEELLYMIAGAYTANKRKN
nr:MAG TPA: hypothetical protein [Caudoviricetes sp.]